MIPGFVKLAVLAISPPLTSRTLTTVVCSSNHHTPPPLLPAIVGCSTYEFFLLGFLSILLPLYTASLKMLAAIPQSLEWPRAP